MSVQIEKLEHNMATLTIQVPAEDFDKELENVFRRNRNRITVPGFRKGKAPRKMIEKLYGAGIFYEDAANALIPQAYDKALSEIEETVVSRPQIDITSIGKGEDMVFTAKVALKPEVTLGQYKGVEVPAPDRTVTEEDIQHRIDRELDSNARMIDVDDRPVEDGDMIKLDFSGSVDGVPFDGGQGTDYPLTIGSGSFIPGFEEQIIGHAIGEDFDVNVTFPENYHAEELKGKAAVFACKVNSIQKKELPALDDEFAQDVSEFDTLEEYREDIRKTLQEQKDNLAKNQKENAVVEKIVEQAQMDIPDAMIDEQVRRMREDFVNRLQQQGMTMEQYMQYTGMDENALYVQMRPEAVRRISNSLVLEAVGKAENIEISEEKVDEEISKMAEQYSMDVENLKQMMGDYEISQIRNDLMVQAAVELVTEAAVETEKAAETEEAGEEENK